MYFNFGLVGFLFLSRFVVRIMCMHISNDILVRLTLFFISQFRLEQRIADRSYQQPIEYPTASIDTEFWSTLDIEYQL